MKPIAILITSFLFCVILAAGYTVLKDAKGSNRHLYNTISGSIGDNKPMTGYDYSLNIYMDTVWMYDGISGKLLGRCHIDSITQFIMDDNR